MKPFCAPPLALPALGAVLGTWIALHATFLPVAGLALLTLLASALGGGAPGRLLAWTSGAAMWVLACGWPAAGAPGVFANRPLAAQVRITGHLRLVDGQARVPVRVERLVSGPRVSILALDAWLSVPLSADPGWMLGTRLRVRGYLKRAAVYRNGAAFRALAWRLRAPSARLVEIVRAPPWFGRWATIIHRRIERAWVAAGSARASARLARALLLGETEALPGPWQQGLRRAGLAHLLAVSGLHVALLAGLVFMLSAPLSRRLRPLLAIAAAGAYLAAVGPRPSILRATSMAAIVLLALALERPPALRNALAATVLLMVACSPPLVDRLSFRLSVAATLGILLLAPLLRRRCQVLPPALRRPLAVTVAAQLSTAPIAVPSFAWLAPSAALANLLAGAWLGLTLALLGVATVAMLLAPSWSSWLAAGLDFLAWPIAGLAKLPAGPWFGWPLAASGGVLVAAEAMLAGAWLGGARTRLAVLAMALAALAHSPPVMDPELTLLDVGQGDAILVRDGSRAVMIDGGGWPHGDFAGRVLVPALAVHGVARLDAMVLTHADRDHCRGLVDLAAYLHASALWAGAHSLAQPCGHQLARRVGGVRRLHAGQQLRVGRWRLMVLASGDEPRARGLGSNDRSLLLLAVVRGRRFLLTGDIERPAERLALERLDAWLRADVLKVAHHGSRSSSQSAWLAAVSPRLALVSVGAGNPYHHPAPTVIARLEAAGAWVLRTDRDGAIRVRVGPGGRLVVGPAGRR